MYKYYEDCAGPVAGTAAGRTMTTYRQKQKKSIAYKDRRKFYVASRYADDVNTKTAQKTEKAKQRKKTIRYFEEAA